MVVQFVPLLAGREAALLLPAPQVTDDLGNFENVARVELFKVSLVTARPVGWLLNIGLTKDLENILETLVINDVTNDSTIYDIVALGGKTIISGTLATLISGPAWV